MSNEGRLLQLVLFDEAGHVFSHGHVIVLAIVRRLSMVPQILKLVSDNNFLGFNR